MGQQQKMIRRPLNFADTGQTSPYQALCRPDGSVVKVLPVGLHTPSSICDMLKFTLFEAGMKAVISVVGEDDDGGFVVEVGMVQPAYPDQLVNMAYWASYDPHRQTVYLSTGVSTMLGVVPVFVLHHSEAVQINQHDGSLGKWAKGIEGCWDCTIQPWLSALSTTVKNYEGWQAALLRSSVPKKYINAAESGLSESTEKTLWPPLVVLSEAIDRMQHDPLRRLDLRRRANTQLRALLR
jgi:hypothetical protein